MARSVGVGTNSNFDLEDSSSSEDEDGPPATDAMLGGLQIGIRTIRSHTRATIGNCVTEASRKETQSRIEDSTLNLIRSEKMFMETARIVSGIVDDIASEDEGGEVYSLQDSNHNWDKLMPQLPSQEEVLCTRAKMGSMLDGRMKDYEESLTKESLESHPKYIALQRQITLGEEDFARKHGPALPSPDGSGDSGTTCQTETVYKPESDGDDETVLPSKDPLSKKQIMNPVRNKFCNHVFEEDSIKDFIAGNPSSRCPMAHCTNQKPLEIGHFVRNSGLTTRIRNKNSSNYYS